MTTPDTPKPRKRGIKTSSAKAKGRGLQQWTRDQILAIYPHLTEDDVRSTSMGASGEDVQLSSAARASLGYQVECKARAKIAVYDWFDQGQSHGKHPALLIIKGDRKKPLAVVDAAQFFAALEELHQLRNTVVAIDLARMPVTDTTAILVPQSAQPTTNLVH